MASVTLSLPELSDWLRARADALRSADLSRPLKTVRLLLISATKRNFADSSDPDGNPWPPLKRQRSRKRDRRNKRGKRGRERDSDLPLRDTGLLMASVTAGGADSIDEITSSGLTFGTSVFYAGYQQHGTRRGIPPRRFLGLNDTLRDRIRSVISAYMTGLLRGTAGEDRP